MKLYAPFIREATLRVTMTLRSEGHGGDPSPKLELPYITLEVEAKASRVLTRVLLHFIQRILPGVCYVLIIIRNSRNGFGF